jgi:hypothetical protein
LNIGGAFVSLHEFMKQPTNLVIEQPHRTVTQKKSAIEAVAKTAKTKQEAVTALTELLPTLKIGYGGSHVWAANKRTNERLFIITGY